MLAVLELMVSQRDCNKLTDTPWVQVGLSRMRLMESFREDDLRIIAY